MSDENQNPPAEDKPTNPEEPIAKGPAPWEHGEKREAPDVDAQSEGEATYLADDKMSLDSKIRGGGRDLGGKAPGENMRLCPACGRVTSFIDDTCSNCKHKLGTGGFAEVEELRGLATGSSELPITRILLIGAIVVIVVAILFLVIPRMFGPGAETAKTEETLAAAGPEETNFVGTLKEISIDTEFKNRLSAAIEAGNDGWEKAGLDCYVYRINIISQVEPAVRQKIMVTGYVGGDDHGEATTGKGYIPFKTGIAPFSDEINSRPGVELSVLLEYTGGDEVPARDDIYLRYGYYYGKEHMSELEPIIKALDTDKFNEKQYPGQLRQNMIPATLNTRGGMFFLPGGIGYLPIYKTNSAGNIIMGSGSGLNSYKPEECVGYYLVKYTKKEDTGLDLYSKDALEYYIQNIAPFPYIPRGPVHNMELVPDGVPDGIACVVKNGVLLK